MKSTLMNKTTRQNTGLFISIVTGGSMAILAMVYAPFLVLVAAFIGGMYMLNKK